MYLVPMIWTSASPCARGSVGVTDSDGDDCTEIIGGELVESVESALAVSVTRLALSVEVLVLVSAVGVVSAEVEATTSDVVAST
jgi:hypothetical protein